MMRKPDLAIHIHFEGKTNPYLKMLKAPAMNSQAYTGQ